MIAACLLPLGMQSGLQTAIERVRAGDVVAAWSAAEGAVDPLEHAQARVYVRQHAGDLEGALRDAVEGSTAHPRDPWLAERALSIALSLSRARPAQTALARLETTLADTNVRDRDAFLAALTSARVEVAALAEAARDRDGAEIRARVVVMALGAGALFVLVSLARRT
jgi:hypothetical protein